MFCVQNMLNNSMDLHKRDMEYARSKSIKTKVSSKSADIVPEAKAALSSESTNEEESKDD